MSPRLQSQPVWFGNTNYGYKISNAPIGGSGLIAHSMQRANVSLSGILLGVSLAPSDLLSLVPFVTDTAGRASLSFPIPGPFVPSLIGSLVYSQAAISDPSNGVIGATQTLQLDVSLRPLMFLAEVSQSPRFADPYSGQQIPIIANYTGAPVDARFINGGRDLLLLTTTGIFHCDSLAASPDFTQWTTGPFEGLEWDALRQRVVSYVPAGGIQILDGARANPTFGQILQQIPGPGPMALSTDGRRGFRQNGANFEVIDFDPASPFFGQPVAIVPSAPTVGIPLTSEVTISSDGRLGTWTYSVAPPGNGGSHVLDLTTGTWIDHSIYMLGVQPLGLQSWPSLNPPDQILWRRDDAAGYMLSYPNAPRRIERNPDNLTEFTVSLIPMASPLPGPLLFWFGEFPLGLTSSGEFAATVVTSYAAFPGPRDFYLIELETGQRIPWFQLPSGGYSFVTAWR